MQNGESQVARETYIVKSIHERRQFRWRERGPRLAYINQSAMNAAQSTSPRELGQQRTTGNQVKLTVTAHAQKFARPYDFKINRHDTLSVTGRKSKRRRISELAKGMRKAIPGHRRREKVLLCQRYWLQIHIERWCLLTVG
jgi:hypothetical protein